MTRRYHLHLPGLIYLALVGVVGLLAMNNQNNLMFWLFGVMFTSLVISGFISGVMMLGVRVRRIDPKQGSVGEPLIVRYLVANRNRLFPVFNIHFEELTGHPEETWSTLMAPAPAWVMHVGPREEVHGEAVYWPTRRGEARFRRVRVWTTFPFGIVKKSITFTQPQHTMIYPRLFELRPDVLDSVTPRGPVGGRVSTRSGPGDDYYGLREHRAGDSLRHIAWKRVAKLDQLVSIERSAPAPPRLRVVINLRTPTADLPTARRDAEAARRLEEQAISLAASLLYAANRAGFEVGLTVLGPGAPPLPVRRNHFHLARMMGTLAAIDLDAPRNADDRVPGAERTGLVIVHPDRVEYLTTREDVWHLKGRQLETFAVRPIGWDPASALFLPAAPKPEVAA